VARDTIIDRLVKRADISPERPAVWHKDGNVWKHLTWRAYVDKVKHFAGALLKLGCEPGDAVAIMAYNSPEWLIADLGAMMVRCVPAGVYQTLTQEQAFYVVNHCEARVFVVESKEILDQVGLPDDLDKLEHTYRVVLMRDAELVDHPHVLSFDDFLAEGADMLDEVEARMAAIELDDLATLIYTSGTTGPPKGVMLSADNLAYTSKASLEAIGTVGPDDAIVSYLPLSHIAEQQFSLHLPITAGCPVWIAESIEKLKDALVIARPTVFLAVPRVWEKFRNALEARLEEATGAKAAIVKWARGVQLEANMKIIEGGEDALGFFEKAQYDMSERLFVEKLKGGLGFDRLKIAVTGAAPIGRDVLEFFASVGIIIHEVYGQSEDTGPTSFNFPEPGKRRLGSVGTAFPGVQIMIAEDGEILVKGRNVFLGYFKNPEATAETLVDGWLHSGDIGTLDEDGFLFITDRKKDLIITAGGKNVAPQNIEKLMKSIDGIGHMVTIGDRRKFLSGLYTIDPDQGPALAAEHGWPTDVEKLAEHPDFLAYLEREIERVNGELARYETIKKFRVIPHDFTPETGELTPTQKIKRRIIKDKYSDLIESMYEGLD
jgi:long-chain acyl-CoA synthetase